jgi:signal transduction histidine kinase
MSIRQIAAPTTAGLECDASADAEEMRLAALARTRLLDSPVEEPYDRIARLAARMLAAPIATVTLIDRDRQFYKACVGLPEPLRSARETPLEYSFCKHTVQLGVPLIIDDTRLDARVADMPSVTQFGVLAYAGVPLLVDSLAIGTLCVMDMHPRSWSDEQVGVLTDLAATVMTEIELRMSLEQLRLANDEAQAARAEADKANRAKSEFLAMMSHDLRAPLNAIGGYRQLLEMQVHGPVTDAQRDALSRMKRAQDHLLDLITSVLTFARLEGKASPPTFSHVPVEATLREISSMLQPQIEAGGLIFASSGGDAAERMYVDVERLTRIVVNLLGNAVKFTPRGGRISLVWNSESSRVVIRVTDTGIGIPADRLGSIFQPFVQIEGQRAMNPEGAGLGLAISRLLARSMDGDLSVTSTPGQGTTFQVVVLRGGAGQAG